MDIGTDEEEDRSKTSQDLNQILTVLASQGLCKSNTMAISFAHPLLCSHPVRLHSDWIPNPGLDSLVNPVPPKIH